MGAATPAPLDQASSRGKMSGFLCQRGLLARSTLQSNGLTFFYSVAARWSAVRRRLLYTALRQFSWRMTFTDVYPRREN